MDRNIEKLTPPIVWKYFKQLTQIPRPSKHEEKVREYLVATAKQMGWGCKVTEVGNVILSKQATDTTSTRKKIVLQAHMDMVPSKTQESTHDFLTDPIDAYIDGEWVTANGTTLGADNGMGVAMALAVLESSDILHNYIEVLITTDEEAGMSGAFGLTGDELTGEVLLNLDSEEDTDVCIGCAGGINTNVDFAIKRNMVNPSLLGLKIELKDLFSGHSGVDIPLGRANAIKEMANLLLAMSSECDFELVSIDGGKLRNVIPSSCLAKINVRAGDTAAVTNFVNKFQLDLQQEFAKTDPELKLDVQQIPAETAIDASQAQSFIFALAGSFNGVWRMNNDLGIAETSSNIGVIKTTSDSIEVVSLQRSAITPPKLKVAASVAAVFQAIGATAEHSGSYPGWQPNVESPALAVVKQVYLDLFGEEIHVGATHGGLECGLIMDKFPTLDAISIGATIRFPHSPNEKINIKSVEKSWKLLVALIEKL